MIATGNVLVINCGSSSIKFSVVDHEAGIHRIKGTADRIGHDDAELTWAVADRKGSRRLGKANLKTAMESIGAVLSENVELERNVVAIGHRVVHGGEAFTQSTRIDDKVLSAIESCNHLAPLHNPANVLGIRTAQHLFPQLPHVAVFDTAFHHPLPRRAYLYAIQ